MTIKQWLYLIRTDLYRYTADIGFKSFLKSYLFVPGFRFSFWLRLCKYIQCAHYPAAIYWVPRLILMHYSIKYGFDIAVSAEIGEGFYIGHFGGIAIGPRSSIGKNCNISQGVSLGQKNRGKHAGVPVILDNVYIGPGAMIIGNVVVGNYAAVGANCVVTKDVPDYGVVVGVPGQVISYEGSEGYVINCEYPFTAPSTRKRQAEPVAV